MNITFIGLGIMGSRMAMNLLGSDALLTVANRSPEPVRRLEKAGAIAADSFNESVKNADIVFTMLSTPEVIESVALSKSGFLSSMKPDAIWVDCSTVDPAFSKQSAQIAAEKKIRFIDAPVGGSKAAAESAELLIYAGGDEADIKTAEPYLKKMGKAVIRVGDAGMGTAFKMIVNSLLGQSMVLFSEAVLWGETMGISKEFLLDYLPDSGVCPPFINFKTEMIRKDQYELNFPLEWMHKDMKLAAKTATDNHFRTTLAETVGTLYGKAIEKGLAREDFAAIYKYMEGGE